MGFINWHNLVNKKSHMVSFVSVIQSTLDIAEPDIEETPDIAENF